MSAAVELAQLVSIVLVCLALGVSRATHHRLWQGTAWPQAPRAPLPLELTTPER